MIWVQEELQGEESGVFDHLVLQIESMCAMERETDIADASEVARAVECFIEHDCSETRLDARALVLMTSRGLESVGRAGVARRFLLHGTGLVKPSEWEVSRGDTMWVVDLKQLTVLDGAPLELIFFTGLGIIIETLSDIWDSTQGRGVLGLRNVCSTAEMLLGYGGKLAEIVSLSGEIQRHCHDRLDRLCRDRGWQERPEIMNLDL
ncbi:MAG: hypothetical protein HQ523_12220 [Lentisphaerae bacterium]|nr:hypothetical protein [Lentisphaerota bacterium]